MVRGFLIQESRLVEDMSKDVILRSWILHSFILVVISSIIPLLIVNPLGIQANSDIGKWFFSAAFQGIAAILGLSFVTHVFIFERLERGVNESREELRRSLPSLCNRLNTYVEPDSNPDNVDNILPAVIGQMREHANILHSEAEKIRNGQKSEWWKSVVKSRFDDNLMVWRTWVNPTYVSKMNLDIFKSKQKENFNFLTSSISSILPALMLSMVFLASSEMIRNSLYFYNAYIIMVLLLSLYSIPRLVFDILIRFRSLFSGLDIEKTEPLNDNLKKIRKLTLQAREDADYLLKNLPDKQPLNT